MCGQEIGLLGAMSAHVKDKELGMFSSFQYSTLHMLSYVRAYIYPGLCQPWLVLTKYRLIGFHGHLPSWGGQVMLWLYILWSNLDFLVWPAYICIPAHYSYIWLLPDLPCRKDIMLSSKRVRYIHAAYTTSSWPVALTLCASLAVLIM